MAFYKKYFLYDTATVMYLFIVSVLIVFFRKDLPEYEFHFISHFSLLLITVCIVNLSYYYPNRFFRCLHFAYPLLFFTFLYKETGIINVMIFPFYFDDFLRHCDLLIFGVSPCEKLFSFFPSAFFCEFMHFVYFCYYLLIPCVWFYYYVKNKQKLEEYLFVVCGSFYVCYLLYIFFPAAGGKVFTDIYAQKGFIFTKIMHYIYLTQEKNGGAFPSSHVALALIALFYSRTINKTLFYIFGIIVISLTVSTVYCGYHFAADVMAGILSGIIFYRIFIWTFYKCNN